LKIWLLIFLLIPSQAFAVRKALDGFDTLDIGYLTITGTGISEQTSIKRTGLGSLKIVRAATTASAVLLEIYTPADSDIYARIYPRIDVLPTTTGAPIFGFTDDFLAYGCRVDIELDGSWSLRYKDRSTYGDFGFTPIQSTGVFISAELHQTNGSTGSCAGPSCSVTCELWLNGVKVLGTTNTDITSGDYIIPTRVYGGAQTTEGGGYTAYYDDFAGDDSTHIGVGRVSGLFPVSDGTPNQWNNTCTGSHAGCIDDFATGAEDDTGTDWQRETTSGNKTTVTLTPLTLASGESLSSVFSFAYAKSVTADARDYRLNQCDGSSSPTNCRNGTTDSPSAVSFVRGSKLLRVLAPDDTAWTQTKLTNLSLQIEHRTNVGNIDVTAIMAYADIREPDPIPIQNLQDKNGDNRLTLAFGYDSVTRGTLGGTCAGNVSIACSTNTECLAYGGICANTFKYSNFLASYVTQHFGKATTILNCGINANEIIGWQSRLPTILTGIGLPDLRYCVTSMPTTCTVDVCDGGANSGAACTVASQCPGSTCAQCSGPECGSTQCTNGHQVNFGCMRSCDLIIGSRICHSGTNAGNDCLVSSECPGSTCSDYPAPDYVFSLGGFNDSSIGNDSGGYFGGGPPMTAPTPQSTPKAGDGYTVQRVACNNDNDCSTGLCSGNLQQACSTNADCSGVGTCTIAPLSGELPWPNLLGAHACSSTCSNALNNICSADNICLGSGTCTGSKVCVSTCGRQPCSTDLDCGPAVIKKINNYTWIPNLYGTCVSGHCTNCGSPGCPSSPDTPQHKRLRADRGPAFHLNRFAATQKLVESAGARHIWLSMGSTFGGICDLGSGASDVISDLVVERQWELGLKKYVIDIFPIWRSRDMLITNRRCNNDATKICFTNSNCTGTGATCVDYASTFRAYGDAVHMDEPGAAMVGKTVWDVIQHWHPVCSGDTTVNCGECHDGTIFKTTTCTTSNDCSGISGCTVLGQMICTCRAHDSICSGTGKGVCSEERAGSLCHLDPSTTCTTNADCVGKGICRPEGLLAPAQG